MLKDTKLHTFFSLLAPLLSPLTLVGVVTIEENCDHLHSTNFHVVVVNTTRHDAKKADRGRRESEKRDERVHSVSKREGVRGTTDATCSFVPSTTLASARVEQWSLLFVLVVAKYLQCSLWFRVLLCEAVHVACAVCCMCVHVDVHGVCACVCVYK